MSKQEARDGRILQDEATTRAKLLEGAEASYEAVATTYGPRGKNFLVEKPFGRAVLTRDGVTVAREVYFSDRAKNLGAQLLLEASENTNRIAGDGTSGTVVLGFHLLRNGIQAIASGVHPMDIKEQYMQDSYTILNRLAELSQPVSDGQLLQVATVSSGSPELGSMIATAVERVGTEGGILTEKAPIDDIECEFVDGYYLQSGFQALQKGKKELTDPLVIVSIRRLTSVSEVTELLTNAAKASGVQPGTIPRFAFIGNIEDAAYGHIVNLANQQIIDAVIIKAPPQFGEMGKQLLEDVAIYAGCKPVTDSTNLKDITKEYVGTITKVVTDKSESTLFADNTTEAVQDRITAIQDQADLEVVDAILEKLNDRISKLKGQIALFRIGAATDTAREEIEFRVEDGIRATRAAAQHGIVAGGGATLLEFAVLGITDWYADALQSTFKRLLENANMRAELKLHEAMHTPNSVNKAFNLRAGDELVDLVEAGILDPTLVVEQIIKNATETIANALSTGGSVVFDEKVE